ncbi:toxin YdaT family protein [Citrobacter arsenatis]|uniref:toxin YdaT family protein n=1 Tax=Citrobacter arsenatis TaxID=2546350 RepID=UPI00300E18C9
MITLSTLKSALDAFLLPREMSQETAARLITASFLSLPEQPDIALHRIEYDDGSVDYGAWRCNRINIFQRWKKCETPEQRESFSALAPAILHTIEKHNPGLHKKITAGTSISYLVSRLLKENTDAINAALNGAALHDFERECDEAEQAITQLRQAYRQQQRHDQ